MCTDVINKELKIKNLSGNGLHVLKLQTSSGEKKKSGPIALSWQNMKHISYFPSAIAKYLTEAIKESKYLFLSQFDVKMHPFCEVMVVDCSD